ncbi:hypothetical protein BT67DRAFT_104596 [Trichocladium antarcticum]|uniref:Uncharacterized protein n=1 Tax=Trichocladium antarcticum TaxID=1450529 RepID=A0AAN6ZFL9_9PEZI|nr:hypothetical protein BT67DRAFT_104596 [Trichocladium antarcticum]
MVRVGDPGSGLAPSSVGPAHGIAHRSCTLSDLIFPQEPANMVSNQGKARTASWKKMENRIPRGSRRHSRRWSSLPPVQTFQILVAWFGPASSRSAAHRVSLLLFLGARLGEGVSSVFLTCCYRLSGTRVGSILAATIGLRNATPGASCLAINSSLGRRSQNQASFCPEVRVLDGRSFENSLQMTGPDF